LKSISTCNGRNKRRAALREKPLGRLKPGISFEAAEAQFADRILIENKTSNCSGGVGVPFRNFADTAFARQHLAPVDSAEIGERRIGLGELSGDA
jgi:hypothetical protein